MGGPWKKRKTKKKCIGCGKELTFEHFHQFRPFKSVTGKEYFKYSAKCKTCQPDFKHRRRADEETKICSHCKLPKPVDEFRIRIEKRKGNKQYTYLNNTCIGCDAEIMRLSREKRKHNPEYKKKRRDYAKAWARKNPEKIRERNKARRQSAEYKKWVKDYWRKNKTQREKHKARLHKYTKELSDNYVKQKMVEQGFSKADITPELIEIYRLRIKMIRAIKTKRKETI